MKYAIVLIALFYAGCANCGDLCMSATQGAAFGVGAGIGAGAMSAVLGGN
ncbi:hypothetical protein OQH61_03535 [Helicobacter sp. MIT 21-1697]|nr:hypothetical protein [Helicobacter sp. MIT 21-1697]MCX2716806.1 hypothetical protein [Helicobacter sp. MIT 21-1697]